MLVSRLCPFASIWLRYWTPGLFQKEIYLDYDDLGGKSSRGHNALRVSSSYEAYLPLAFKNQRVLLRILLLEVFGDLKKIVTGKPLSLVRIIHREI